MGREGLARAAGSNLASGGSSSLPSPATVSEPCEMPHAESPGHSGAGLRLCRDRRKGSSFGSKHLNLTPDTPASLPHMLLDQSEAGFADPIWRTGTVTLMLGVLVVSRTTLGRSPATKIGMKSTVCSLLQLAAGSPR